MTPLSAICPGRTGLNQPEPIGTALQAGVGPSESEGGQEQGLFSHALRIMTYGALDRTEPTRTGVGPYAVPSPDAAKLFALTA